MCCRDMRISNIMEHRTDADPYLPSGFTSGKAMFKLAGKALSSSFSLASGLLCSVYS